MEEDKIKNAIAVVIDVLLATSTIVMALEEEVSVVTPVKNSFSGHSIHKKDIVNNLLMEEKEGELIGGMQYPDPNLLNAKENEYKRSLILLITNGAVAIENSLSAKELYVSSLLMAILMNSTFADQIRQISLDIFSQTTSPLL